jgi:putative ABC transport system ATP-binding protein
VSRDTVETPAAMPPGEPLLRVDGVSKTYRTGSLDTAVLRDATLTLHQGQTTSLLGVSGSGKTTLLSLLAGLLLPDSGELTFDGQRYGALDDARLASLRANRIGIVLQSGNLVPFLTAAENVELPIKLAGGGNPTARARELLAEVGLADRHGHRPGRLSGGEAQRVAVAMALANDPDLLLADEATAELDSATAERVMDVIFTAWQQRGLAVLYVTHSRVLANVAQQQLQLIDGEVRVA